MKNIYLKKNGYCCQRREEGNKEKANGDLEQGSDKLRLRLL